MSNQEDLDIALSAEMVAEVRASVASGDYADVGEAVADALQDWKARRQIQKSAAAELQRLVQEGIESGPGLDADAVFAELRTFASCRPHTPAGSGVSCIVPAT